MRKFLKNLFRFVSDTLICELPLFVISFVLLNPMWFSVLKKDLLEGALLLFMTDKIVTCDLYATLLFSWIISGSVVAVAKLSYKSAKILKTVIYICLVISFLVRKFLLWEFDMDYGPQVLSLVQETNIQESQGFIQTFLLCNKGLMYLGVLFFVIAVIVLIEWIFRRYLIKRIDTKFVRLPMTMFFFLLLPLCVKSMSNYETLKTYSGENTITGIMAAWGILQETKQETSDFIETVEQMSRISELASCKEQGLDIVFVLGESFIKKHASIYQYDLCTMPHMEQEIQQGNLYLLNDVISPFARTTPSFKNIMSLNNLAKNERWCDGAFLPLIFRKSGWNVEMWDNQRAGDRHFVGSFHEMWNGKVSQLCYNYISDIPYKYDEDIINGLSRSKTLCGNDTDSYTPNSVNNLFFIHFKGQHFPVRANFPDTVKTFSAVNIIRRENWITESMKEAIANYDNAIVYNDIVLYKLFNIFRKRKAVIVYISDHGEEIYDYRDKSNRPALQNDMISEYAHYQHDTPCMIWISDSYKEMYPEVVNQVIKAKDVPYTHDLIGNMLLTLSHIQTKYYQSSDDVLNPSYNKRKRVIFPNGRSNLNYYEDMIK